MKRTTAATLSLALLFISAAGCGKSADGKASPDSGRPPVAVEAARATTAEVEEAVEVVGTLTARSEAEVKTEYSGTVVEVFEWRSAEAIEQAHMSPAVGQLWGEFAAVCDYVPLVALNEAQQPFAEFEPLQL